MTTKAGITYRDSGVDWLGVIPETWQVKPFWTLYRREKSTGHPEEELLSVYRDYGVIPKSSRDDNGNVESEDLNAYQLVEPNDLVMNKMKAWQGSIAVSGIRGIVSPAYFVFKPRHKAHGPYLHHLLRSKKYIGEYNRLSKGIRVGQWDLEPTAFRTTPIVLPPLEQQVSIAEFLDRETAQIDALIDKQKQLIETLAERRKSLISRLVRKGIDKNSENFPNFQLGRFSQLISEKTTPVEFNVSLENIQSWTSKFIETISFESEATGTPFRPGDVLFGKLRPYLAKVYLAQEFGAAIGDIWVIRSSEWEPSYLKYAFLDKGFIDLVNGSTYGTKMPRASWDFVKSIELPMPDREVQRHISFILDKKMDEIDSLVQAARKMIDLLRERREALISAAVTGKIDVRGK